MRIYWRGRFLRLMGDRYWMEITGNRGGGWGMVFILNRSVLSSYYIWKREVVSYGRSLVYLDGYFLTAFTTQIGRHDIK